MSDKQLRNLHLVGATGKMRTAAYDGREHLVVPVVAMVEGVVWAVNSEYPELVLAKELAHSPQQWNGRACFAGHPEDGGTQVTANTPNILEKSFGVIFNTASAARILETKRLEFEVFIDAEKAKRIGPDTAAVVERLQQGKTVEVSVGAYVTAEQVEGEHEGKPYVGIWREIVSDHIAFLAEGETGACSVAAGCGAPRTAVRHIVTAEGIQQEEGAMDVKPIKSGLKDRFLAFLEKLRNAEGFSDAELRRSIDKALRADEPGYVGIEEVYPDDGYVIYSVAPEDEWLTMRRNYVIDSDGIVKLKGAGEQVELQQTYVAVEQHPVAASTHTPCSCGGGTATTETTADPITDIEGVEPMKTLAERITDLKAANKLTSIPEALIPTLTEAQVAVFEGATASAVAPSPTVVLSVNGQNIADAATPKTVAPVTKTQEQIEEEYLATAPQTIRDMYNNQKAKDQARRTELVAKLATAKVYTAEELNVKSLDDLEKMNQWAEQMQTSNAPALDFAPLGSFHAAAATDYNPAIGLDPFAPHLEGYRASYNRTGKN